MTISDQLAEWNSFYTAVAGVAGVLVGLLFVALALSPTIMNDDGPPGLRVMCGETFHGLVNMLAFALIFLMPSPGLTSIGIPIAMITASGLYRMKSDIALLRTDPNPQWSGRWAGYRRFGYVIAAYGASLVIGIGLILDRAAVIDWMVLPIFLLLVNSAINCWNILKDVGKLNHS